MNGRVPLWWLRRLNRRNGSLRPGFSGSALRNYECRKRAWIEANPGATPEQYQRAMSDIAREVGI